MKKALLLAIVAIISVGTAFAANPLLRQKYTADPNAFVWGDRLYVYASYDSNNPIGGGYDIRFYTLMSTDDMANWTDHGEVFSVKRDIPSFGNCYAPGAAVKNNKVYIYVPDGGSSIGAAVADRPEGPFTGGKQIISKNTANNTNVPWLFDPAGFVDSDGQGYIYFGGAPDAQNLRVAKLNADMMSVQFPATTINNTVRPFEAAFMHKYNGKYYFSYSQDFNGAADIAYMIGNNPMGPFEFKGTMVPNGAEVGYGNNHASVVEYKSKWYVFYHDRRLKNTNNNNEDAERRSVSADKLEYNTDGTIKKATLTTAGPDQIKNFNPYDTVLATTMFKQSGNIKTAICSAPNPGTIVNDNNGNSAGTAGDRCVLLTNITDNSWVNLKKVDFGTAGATKFVVRAASTNANASIEIRTGSADNSTNNTTLAGTCAIGTTNGLTTWKEIECNVSNLTGVKDYLYLVFKGNNFRVSKYIFKTGTSTPSSSSIASSSSVVASSSSRVVSSSSIAASSSSAGLTTCEYRISFCGGLPYSSVLSNSTTIPKVGECLYIGDFSIIQPYLNSTVAINGLENTFEDEWLAYNERPEKKDDGYYVYVKAGKVNDNTDNAPEIDGWRGIVAKEKPGCTPLAETPTPIINHSLIATSHSPTYYSLKGEPLGNAKPQKAGIYIVKQGSSVQKIAVR